MSSLPNVKKSVNNGEIKGYCDPGFGRVAEEFERNFNERGEVGASVCVQLGGETFVDLWGGARILHLISPGLRIPLPMYGPVPRERQPSVPICLFREVYLTAKLLSLITGQNLARLAKSQFL